MILRSLSENKPTGEIGEGIKKALKENIKVINVSAVSSILGAYDAVLKDNVINATAIINEKALGRMSSSDWFQLPTGIRVIKFISNSGPFGSK